MRVQSILIITIGCLLTMLPVEAGIGTAVPVPMTLEQCLETALTGNPDISAANSTAEAARSRVAEQKGDYWPQVEAVAGVSRWQQLAFLPEGLTMPGLSPIIGPTDDWSADIRASYTLYDAGSRGAAVNLAKAHAAAAADDATRIDRLVRLRVTESYFRVLAAIEHLQAVENRLKRSADHVTLAEARYDTGAVPRLDVVRSRTEQANVKQALAEARRLVQVALGELNQAMGRQAAEPLVVAVRPAVLVDPAELDVKAAVSVALGQRTEVAAAMQQAAAAAQEVKLAKSAFAPKVVASAAVGRRDTTFFPDEDTWSVGVTLKVPIFTGGKRKHRISSSRQQVTVAESRLAQVKLAVGRQVWDAHAGLVAAVEAAAAATERVTEARESLRLVNERYTVDASTIHDVMDTEQALSEAEAADVSARWGVSIANARYHWTIGDLEQAISTL